MSSKDTRMIAWEVGDQLEVRPSEMFVVHGWGILEDYETLMSSYLYFAFWFKM